MPELISPAEPPVEKELLHLSCKITLGAGGRCLRQMFDEYRGASLMRKRQPPRTMFVECRVTSLIRKHPPPRTTRGPLA